MVVAVCTWSGTGFQGNLNVYYNEEPQIPPTRSVKNQDLNRWCFYEKPFFEEGGRTREVGKFENVKDLGFQARSARQEACQNGGED
ncbi:hypothetical protein GBW32_31270 [Streptomyces tsukubensis]|uniref:hypothetical protein n=1 Tax=Streptomyces tsukubensis TaxID=83656 RepID=UPI001265FF39|nr:hypothetical protein [Streptomyces tsukubensis]QFR96696.1 hypothetical protein GBW32_31270 [Streptomyces tsukubensis]